LSINQLFLTMVDDQTVIAAVSVAVIGLVIGLFYNQVHTAGFEISSINLSTIVVAIVLVIGMDRMGLLPT